MTELPVTNCRNAQRSSWSSRETNCCKKCNVFSWSWRRCSSSGTMTARTYCAVGCCCWKRWSIAGTVNNDQNASLWTSGMPNFMSSTNGIGLSKSCCRLAMLCTNWQMLCAVGKVYMPYSPRMVSRLSCSWMVKLEKSASDLSSTVQSMSSRNNLHYICSTVYASHKCLGLTWWNIRLLQQLLSHCDRQWWVVCYSLRSMCYVAVYIHSGENTGK